MHAECLQSWNDGFQGYFLPMTMTEEQYISRLHHEGLSLSHSLIAFDGGQPIGCVLSGFRQIAGQKVAWNGGTGVAPDYRRKGVGRRLMTAMLEHYRAEGADLALLEAIAENEGAIALYQQLGYRRMEELAIWKKEGMKEENVFAAPSPSFDTEIVPPHHIAKIPFYRRLAPWQTQWQSNLHGHGLIVKDEQGETIGYALYRHARDNQGALQRILLLQCEARPGHPDADAILGSALHRVFKPEESYTFGMVLNQPPCTELAAILEEAGFQPASRQVHMQCIIK
ncbi:GNAT family N-acetyltransferase [Marinithermofilum abyssi]|nr:GNAT family N-acetyltransferase [Marinithermofilum abyssi]